MKIENVENKTYFATTVGLFFAFLDMLCARLGELCTNLQSHQHEPLTGMIFSHHGVVRLLSFVYQDLELYAKTMSGSRHSLARAVY